MVNIKKNLTSNKFTLEQLIEIIKVLRSPEGCPWDREQTHKSIRSNFLEEVYETVDAIDRENFSDMREELGDVLMQVIFHSVLAEEAGNFTFEDVVDEVSTKLVYRHPHVFGDTKVKNTDEVLDNWEKLKQIEKKQHSYTETLTSVPAAFPALMRAAKVQKRASKAGYDFTTVNDAFMKIKEETDELEGLIGTERISHIKEEIGDILFSVVNTARLIGIDCEEALTLSTNKFTARFSNAEKMAESDGKDLKQLSAEQLEEYWQKAKLL